MEMMRELEKDGDYARVSNNRLFGERERRRERDRERQRDELPFTKTKLKKIERDMEEIRKLAMIHHAKLSNDQKQWTRSVFEKIDKNGDEKVTVQEFFGYFITGGNDYLEKLFMFLDKNHNGTLDFEECVTFFYMIASNRLLECDGCGSLLLAAYFLCVECYNANREETYNLCCSCYSDNNFTHAHSYFLDNYALLLQKEIKKDRKKGLHQRRKTGKSNSAAESSSQKLEEPTGVFGLNSGVEYSYPRNRVLNNTSGQAGSTRSKIGKIVELADTHTSYDFTKGLADNMEGIVDNMGGLVLSTLSKSGNTSQGSKHEKIKEGVHSFLMGYKVASIVLHVHDAAHVLAACAIM